MILTETRNALALGWGRKEGRFGGKTGVYIVRILGSKLSR
jgi:hypothetical protein